MKFVPFHSTATDSCLYVNPDDVSSFYSSIDPTSTVIWMKGGKCSFNVRGTVEEVAKKFEEIDNDKRRSS
jgi:hypothetical protein